MSVNIIKGNLLDASQEVLVHQLNCLSVRGRGLSAAVAERFPGANVYGRRTPSKSNHKVAITQDRGIPGEIVVDKISSDKFIIGIYGQYDFGMPGATGRTTLSEDSLQLRELWFLECLTKLGTWLQKNKFDQVAMPYKIGCGLARGNWRNYQAMIHQFALDFKINVYLYQI